MGFWLPFTIGLSAAATAYSGYASAKAAEKAAAESRRRTAQAREAAQAEIKQMQADAAQRQQQFNTHAHALGSSGRN